MQKPTAKSRAFLAAFLVLAAACGGRASVALAPLPDHPWTVMVSDEVRVRVFREPDLSGQFLVNTQGELRLPGLGKLSVVGLSVDSLTTVIEAFYTRRVVNAIVEVGIVRSLPVLGAVRIPGVFAVEPTWTVQQVLARAGGYSGERGDMQVVLRKGRDQREFRLSTDSRLDRLPFEEGDAIVAINPSFLVRNASQIAMIYTLGTITVLFLQIYLVTKR